MRKEQLKTHIMENALEPTIFGYADANHYLVGAEDQQGNFFSLSDDKDGNVIFNSMYEAECYLKGMGFEKANLHMQTAYDEMIGNEVAGDTRLTLNLSDH